MISMTHILFLYTVQYFRKIVLDTEEIYLALTDTPKHTCARAKMAQPPGLLLRVYINADTAHKVILPTRPSTLDELISFMQERFNLEGHFTLQYEDPDFDGELCVLTEMSELPSKAVVRIIRPDNSNDSPPTEFTTQTQERTQRRPNEFSVPTFSYDVEHILEICAEFHRITSTNLKSTFYSAFDKYMPRLMTMYLEKAARTGKTSELLRNIFRTHDLLTSMLTADAQLLCRHFPSSCVKMLLDFFKTWNAEDIDLPDLSDTTVAVLIVSNDTVSLVKFGPAIHSIVLEGDIVVCDIAQMTEAFILLFGLIYALHLQYPKKLSYTFNFIQKVVMGLDDLKRLPPRLLSLKNDLMIDE
ncbi:uncharacterized protein LOC121711464 isoform X1 [Alosa sapidissima]|uniref:uncharacterized protein LOC121711464 isoform X1 n=1 Tax=Alosa sapidissima TaxID=34773 RepID=UPI001C0A080D|nr:uncharacterized protein LOC121711464 isoform X1 [Alosa sapidissima]